MAINFTGAVFVNLSNLFTTWPAQGGNFYFEPYCGSRPKGGTLHTVRNGEGILGLVSSNTWFLRLIDIYTLSFRPRGLIIFFGTPFFPPLQVFFFISLGSVQIDKYTLIWYLAIVWSENKRKKSWHKVFDLNTDFMSLFRFTCPCDFVCLVQFFPRAGFKELCLSTVFF